MSLIKYDNPEKVIALDNALINARYFMTLNELRIFALMLCRVGKDDSEFSLIKIPCQQLFPKKNVKYEHIKEAAKKLASKTIEVEVLTAKNKRKFDAIPLMSWCSYTEGEGYVTARFNDLVKPYVLNLKKNFTSAQLKLLNTMTSFYSWRLYWLLKQYEDFGKRRFGLAEFAEKMMIEKKYQEWYDIKRRVLQPVQRDLSKSDMRFEYEVEKEGRRVAYIHFTLNPKTAVKSAKGEPVKRIPKSSNRTQQKNMQGELDFDQQAAMENVSTENTDSISRKLMKFGLSTEEATYFKAFADPKKLKRTIYSLDVKYTGSSIRKDQLRGIVVDCLNELVGLEK